MHAEIRALNSEEEWAMTDLDRPFSMDSEVRSLSFEQDAFWHSSAHILGYAIEQTFDQALLTHGPATKDGFFYDFFSPSGQVVSSYDDLDKSIKKIIKSQHPFERLALNKE